MGIDFGYANMDAVDATGVLNGYDSAHGHPQGWTRALILKVQQDMMNDPQHKEPTQFDWSGYSSEEKAAYEWYSDDVIEPGHWKQIVSDYQANAGSHHVTPDTFDENHQYIPGQGDGFTPPSVTEWNGGNNPNHELSVSTDALNHFANELDQISGDGTGILIDAHKVLDKVELHPGAFAKAEILRQTIVGTGANSTGLRGETMDLLHTVHEALFAIKTNLRQMIKEYDSAEEFNGLTAAQLNDVMGDAWSKIGTIKTTGQGHADTSGGS